jgi:hypothetical protein
MNPSKRLNVRKVVLLSIIPLLLIGLAIMATLPSGTKSLELSASLSEKVGVVEARTSGQDPYQPVSNGFMLDAKMLLQTKEESRVRLDLSSGSIVRLGQSTIFSLKSQEASSEGVLSKIELQIGKLWIVLKGGSLDVNTPAGLASVRGSYMCVYVDPITKGITVCCLEGACSYSNAAGVVQMTYGQKINSSDTNIVPPIEKMDQADFQAWLDNSPESAPIVAQIQGLMTSATVIASYTPTFTPTPTIETVTMTPTETLTPDLTNPASSGAPTPTVNSSTTLSPTNSTGAMTPTLLKSATNSPGGTVTPSPTPSKTSTFGPTPTPTPTQVNPPTSTPMPTNTPPPPTNTPVPTTPPTNTPAPTPTPTPVPYP